MVSGLLSDMLLGRLGCSGATTGLLLALVALTVVALLGSLGGDLWGGRK